MNILFEDLKKYVLVEIARYTITHDVDPSKRKVPFNDWVLKVRKGRTVAIKNYTMLRISIGVIGWNYLDGQRSKH